MLKYHLSKKILLKGCYSCRGCNHFFNLTFPQMLTISKIALLPSVEKMTSIINLNILFKINLIYVL